MKFVKKFLISIFLLLAGIFMRVLYIGHIINDFVEGIAWTFFGVAFLIVVDALIEEFARDDKDKKE